MILKVYFKINLKFSVEKQTFKFTNNKNKTIFVIINKLNIFFYGKIL